MHFRLEYFFKYFIKLFPYLKVTFSYVLASLAIGIVAGFFLAWFKVGKNKVLKVFGNVYTALFRSIPSVVLLFLVYYGLPAVSEGLFGVSLRDKTVLFFVIVTVSLLSSASISETMRSAYKSVDKGQFEAAISVGLSPFKAFTRIVFPQALYHAIPSFGNLVTFLIKEGSLGFTIGLVDIFGKANTMNQNTYSNYILEIYISLALIYWLVAIAIEQLLKLLENRISTHKTAKT